MQSFDGVGPELARRIVAHFEGLPLTWTATDDELLEVPGLGPKTLRKLHEVIP